MTVTWSFRCVCWEIVSSLLVAVLVGHCWSSRAHLALRFAEGVVAVLLLLSSLMAFHISTLRCSESHTLTSLLLSYRLHQSEWLATPFILAKVNWAWRHPREAQEDLIPELTRRHAKTEYGRKNRLGEIRSVEDLRKKHRLTTYDHFKEYIQRLADGEKEVFLGEEPVRFGVTSGTTGTGKKIPYGGFFFEGELFAYKLMRLATYQGISRPSPVQKRCWLYTHPKFSVTKSGLAAAAYLFVSENDEPYIFLPEQTSPLPAFSITGEPSATYVHMLFAIADPNLAILQAGFTSQLYRAMVFLETNWPAMLEDLSTGKICAKIPLDPDLRRSLQGYLRPDPDRVSQLRREFEKGFVGILKRIWPHLRAIDGIDAPGFKKKLEEKYAKGLVCVLGYYSSTEVGTPGVNMWITEEEPRYVLLPNIAVYEFIPEEKCFENDPPTLLIDEVETGGRYELVSTTRSGLYRYRNGDVVQVTGFHERCPVFRFLYRTGEYLNLVCEKMNTQVVDAAVKSTVESWPGVQLVDWTCAESTIYDDGSPELYYIVFIEIITGGIDFTEDQLSKFDEYLQKHQYFYGNLRASSTISKPHVHFVTQGAFQGLMDITITRTTATANQYKTPRKLRTRQLVEWMMGRVIN